METRPLMRLTGGTAGPRPPAALALGSGQIVAPGAVVSAADLVIDEAVDALVTDAGRRLVAGQPAGDLLGRPAVLEAIEDKFAQLGIALQARARPAAGSGLLLGVGRLVANLHPAIALQLARDARWRAIQSCRDLLDRTAGFVKLGNLAPLLEPEMTVVFPHRNTLSWCCTSFVNSGGPFLSLKAPRYARGDSGVSASIQPSSPHAHLAPALEHLRIDLAPVRGRKLPAAGRCPCSARSCGRRRRPSAPRWRTGPKSRR